MCIVPRCIKYFYSITSSESYNVPKKKKRRGDYYSRVAEEEPEFKNSSTQLCRIRKAERNSFGS